MINRSRNWAVTGKQIVTLAVLAGEPLGPLAQTEARLVPRLVPRLFLLQISDDLCFCILSIDKGNICVCKERKKIFREVEISQRTETSLVLETLVSVCLRGPWS